MHAGMFLSIPDDGRDWMQRYFCISVHPVISSGCGRFIRSRRVGAISARMPLPRSVRPPPFGVMRRAGTGFVECAVTIL